VQGGEQTPGNNSTKPHQRDRVTGTSRNISTDDLASKKPHPIPRKLPSSTKFVT